MVLAEHRPNWVISNHQTQWWSTKNLLTSHLQNLLWKEWKLIQETIWHHHFLDCKIIQAEVRLLWRVWLPGNNWDINLILETTKVREMILYEIVLHKTHLPQRVMRVWLVCQSRIHSILHSIACRWWYKSKMPHKIIQMSLQDRFQQRKYWEVSLST